MEEPNTEIIWSWGKPQCCLDLHWTVDSSYHQTKNKSTACFLTPVLLFGNLSTNYIYDPRLHPQSCNRFLHISSFADWEMDWLVLLTNWRFPWANPSFYWHAYLMKIHLWTRSVMQNDYPCFSHWTLIFVPCVS